MIRYIQEIASVDKISAVLFFLAFIIAIYFAIVPHEIAHGLVAKWNGDYTAKNAGRISMNPIVHFDLFGFLMLLTIGFGYAKPVPVNPYNFRVPRRGMFTVAIAGVVYNIIAAVVCIFLYVLSLYIVSFTGIANEISYYVIDFFTNFFMLCGSVNIALFLFNIIPLGPLDGFKIIEAYANRDNKFIGFLRNYGNYILIGLFVISVFVDYVGDYALVLNYFDILGNYLLFCSDFIRSGLLNLFLLIFGMA